MSDKYQNVFNFYAITHKLKNTIRSGLVNWEVKSERLESVAEHIYGTQMLAFVINSEFKLNLDMQKVIYMLAMHELGETLVGDITFYDGITREEKHRREQEAVQKILSPLADKNFVQDLYNEFEVQKTKEALFAHRIDKFEHNLQIKYYDEKGQIPINKKRKNKACEQIRQDYLAKGYNSISSLWIDWDKEKSNYDKLFKELADYVLAHKIFIEE